MTYFQDYDLSFEPHPLRNRASKLSPFFRTLMWRPFEVSRLASRAQWSANFVRDRVCLWYLGILRIYHLPAHPAVQL